MKLEGMSICFLGDSITQGVGCSANSKTFHQLIAKEYRLKRAYNYGISGTRIAPQKKPTCDCLMQDLNFCLRAQAMDRQADAVVVFGGTNDYGHGDALLGTVENHDPETFCGAVHHLIDILQGIYTGKKIVFILPLHRRDERNPETPEGKILQDYVEPLRAICVERKVDIIDLFTINPLDPNDRDLVPDGLHPNDKGHEILAKVIGEALTKL